MFRCPRCGSREVGRVGVGQYYCWECFVEFNEANEIFEVAEDGSLLTTEGDSAGEAQYSIS